jgi:hypothetical protein
MSYSFLAEGYIPIMEAASLLAFGDRDFVSHVKCVDVWLETGLTPSMIVEADRHRVDDLGRIKSSDWGCPELDRELDVLQQCASAGNLTIIALRRAVEHWDRAEYPPINIRYEPIPAEFFQYNDWFFYWDANGVAISKPFDRTTKTGSPFAAEWFNPAVALRDVEVLRIRADPAVGAGRPPALLGNTEQRAAEQGAGIGTDSQIANALRQYVKDLPKGGIPNMDDAVDYVMDSARFPRAGRDRVRQKYRDVTGRGIDKRGHRGPNRRQ